jgi:histidine ammonia-lyase
MFHRYAAASRWAALRALADPATLDVGPLDNGVEDHATNAPESARISAEALDAEADILAVEVLMARALLIDDETRQRLGRGTARALDAIETMLEQLPADGLSGDAVAGAKRLLTSGDLAALGGA